MNRFWNLTTNPDGERVLRLDGPLAEETWWGDEVTPKAFKDELFGGVGNVSVWINSFGGDVFAGAQIYNALKEYSTTGKGKVTVKVDAIAASAASVVAMAGDKVLMSPVSWLFIHNPSTIAIGDGAEMLRVKAVLDEIKEAIINVYERKSRQTRAIISELMDREKWINANEAVDYGFADGILYDEGTQFRVMNSLLRRITEKPPTLTQKQPQIQVQSQIPHGNPHDVLQQRQIRIQKFMEAGIYDQHL